jgi:hypothetical protein
MNDQITEILARIQELEQKLELELEHARELYGVKFKGKAATFEKDVIEKHRRFRVGLLSFLLKSRILVVLTSPIIYSLIIPLVLIDVWVTFYQHICFRAYGIARVVRSDYMVIDRQHLAYLNLVEKINCVFCGYGNGVIAYAREIASRTEQFWCPIKHALRIREQHERYMKFVEYGDAEGYRAKNDDLRKDLPK